MTKFILHGGNTSKDSLSNRKFFEEMTKDLTIPVTVLYIYFARNRDIWPKLFKQDKEKFEESVSHNNFKHHLAVEDAPLLWKQINAADIIYIRGGNTRNLIESLSVIKDLPELLKDKVVSGSSAGAHALAKHYYTHTQNRIQQGLGILPIKTICHYTEENSGKLKELEELDPQLKTHPLAEEEFTVINTTF